MATGGEEQVGYNLVDDRTITLDNADERPDYVSIVISQDKIIVLDDMDGKVKIHRLHDGNLLDMLDSDSRPRDICLMDATTICVLHIDGLIEMASIKSEDMSPVFTRMKSFRLDGVFDWCYSVVRVNDNIVVVGVKQDTTYWCITSLDGGDVDTIHRICKKSLCSFVTTKDNIIYISCCCDDDDDTGVYGIDILNPSQCKYKYKHERLRMPTSIVINEDGNIFIVNRGHDPYILFNGEYGDFFVGNGGYDSCIHQLTSSCQPVAIFSEGIPEYLQAMFWDNGRLYVTRLSSRDITVFRHVHQGSHKESEVLVSDERKVSGVDESAIQISQENVYNGQSSVETEMCPSAPSSEDSEDEKREVPFSDEGKQLFIEGTSTQIEQEISIEQSIEKNLNQAGIKMSTEERDLFIKFQNEIGTDICFSKGPHRLIDGQECIKATEIFIEQKRPDMKDKWQEYKSQGKLTPELIDVIYAEERNKELHENKEFFLNTMEQLNIIIKAKAFNENGVKEENYFFTPSMLHKESPREVIDPEKDARMVNTSVLCWVITGTSMLLEIFQKLIAACLALWPVAKEKNTNESLIFQNCTVFDLDPIHRLFLHCDDQAVFARITGMGIDQVNAKMCTRVRKFITLNLSHQDPNIKYQLCLQNIESQDIPGNIGSRFTPPFEMWLVDEVHDPTAPITREHMNYARLCVAIIAICGNAMRAILLANPPAPHTNIFQAILANKTKLISRTQDGSGKWQKALLNRDQCKMLFQDPKCRFMASIDQLDISLLYTLIINISRVKPPSTAWGVPPQDRPRDKSLGANVERIHLFRNEICGHTVDGQISQPKFDDYWKKIDSVLRDIDVIVGQEFSQELEMQRRQVISVYEAC